MPQGGVGGNSSNLTRPRCASRNGNIDFNRWLRALVHGRPRPVRKMLCHLRGANLVPLRGGVSQWAVACALLDVRAVEHAGVRAAGCTHEARALAWDLGGVHAVRIWSRRGWGEERVRSCKRMATCVSRRLARLWLLGRPKTSVCSRVRDLPSTVVRPGSVRWAALIALLPGCESADPELVGELSQLQELHAQERLRLDGLREEISRAEERAALARKEAQFHECKSTVAELDADVALRKAQCMGHIARHNQCLAQAEAAAAKGGIGGCLLGFGAALFTGGAAAPWALGGCAAGVGVGAASAKECPPAACATDPAALRPLVLAQRGLAAMPMCGGYLGIEVRDALKVADRFMVIGRVGSLTTAEGLGLQRGDIVLRMQGVEMAGWPSLEAALMRIPPGSWIDVDVVRDGRRWQVRGVARAWAFEGRSTGSRTKLGAEVRFLSKPIEYAESLSVASVDSEGPAALAGLQVGDEVTMVNDSWVYSSAHLEDSLRLLRAGTEVAIEFRRNGDDRSTLARLAPRNDRTEI